MKKAIIIILSFWVTTTVAQNIKPFHFSVVQGVSTDGKESKNTDYYFSLNMFSGTVRSMKGVEIGSFYNQNEGDMTGFQSSGLVNMTKGNVMGYQNAGITNISGDVKGLQQAGISNHSKDLIGIQMAGITNLAKDVAGLQVSGIFNKADNLKGLQIGLINMAESVEKGGGIGLINLYKKGGYREFEVSVADYQNVGLSFKSGVKKLYSILNIGYNFSPTSLFSTGFGIGQLSEIRQNLYFKPEIVWYNYVRNDFKFNASTNVAHLKFGIMQKAGKVGITLSPSIYYANIANNLEGDLTEISRIKAFSQTKNGRFGFGIALGIAFLK